jgi:hypothetical protein
MKPIESFIVGIESAPWSAIYRGAIGFAMPPMFRTLSGGNSSVWITSALFVGLLIALRVVPAALRRILPFSADAKQAWAARRALSKEYDSYAWHKLLWFGLGLLLYGVIGGGLWGGELAVTLFCLIGGGAGLLVWRGMRAVRSAPQ